MQFRIVLAAVLLLLSQWSAVGLAADPPVPIEGLMYLTRQRADWSQYGLLVADQSDLTTPAAYYHLGNLSPLESQIAYEICDNYDGALSVARSLTIWIVGVDGSSPRNLTEQLGLSGPDMYGVNCQPEWSPDGSMITFFRTDTSPGVRPCDAGFDVWVAQADGSAAWKVSDESVFSPFIVNWAPNGYRLLCWEIGSGAFTIDTDGTDRTPLPNVGLKGRYSPDGSRIASIREDRGNVDGADGQWEQVLITNADGSDPVYPTELRQFVRDDDVYAHLSQYGYDTGPTSIWPGMCRAVLGPNWVRWSPRGDRLAFTASAPGLGASSLGWDPEGASFQFQVELWVYALPSEGYPTGDLTRLTDNQEHDVYFSWNGHNTFPDDPEVTVDNTTVTFAQVAEGGDGLTTIIRDDDPPDLPSGFGFASEYYEISTTAAISGRISVSFTYRHEDIPSGTPEAELCILHYNEGTSTWDDITTLRDPVNNIVYGESDSLSLFGLSMPVPLARFSDVPATGYGSAGYSPYWAFYEIGACVDAGIVQGYDDGTYRPKGEVKRDAMAVFIARAMCGGEEYVPTGPPTASFTDVAASSWAYDHIEYAVEHGIVTGYTEPDLTKTYRPSEKLNRGQMAAFLARSMCGGEGLVPPGPVTPSFPDVATDFKFYNHVEYILAHGVTTGYGDGTYRPSGSCLRDQMAVFVVRAFSLPT